MKIKTWQYIVIGLLVLGAVGLLALTAWLAPYDLKKEQAAARAAGLPLSEAEFARPRPPADQDAAPEWLALDKDLEKRPLDTKAIDSARGRNGSLAAEIVPEVRRLLRERADLVARIHSAAVKPHAYFEIDYDLIELFPHYAKMREAAKVLRWESVLLAREGKYADAVRTQELGFNIAGQLANAPLLIGMLVSLAADAISTAGMEDILYEAGPDARVAALVEQALRRHPVATSLARSLKGEVLFGVTRVRTMTVPSQVGAPPGGTPVGARPSEPVNPLFRRFFLEPSEAAYLHWMTRQYQAAQRPMPERKVALEQVTRDLQKGAKGRSPAMIMTGIIMPVFGKADDRNTQGEARHAVTRAAAAVLAHRDRTGQWPESLASVTPKPPADPFTGKPLGYRREAKGFVVYSVGDSGAFTAKPGQPEKNQSLFRYPRPARMAAPPASPAPGGPPMPGGPPIPGGSPMPGGV